MEAKNVVRLLVTGVTGTVGRAVLDFVSDTKKDTTGQETKRIKPGWIIYGIAFSESKIYALEQLYKHPETTEKDPNLILYAGDICDAMVMDKLVSNVDAVINTAAMKRIEKVQQAPISSFRTNVVGPLILSEVCRKYNKQLVQMSTDKAVEPICAYGAQKRLAEEIVLGNDMRDPNPKKYAGVVVRSGNILASAGALPVILYKESKHGFISKFNEGHTRYFVDRSIIARILVKAAINASWKGKIVIPKNMKLWGIDEMTDEIGKQKCLEVKSIDRIKLKGELLFSISQDLSSELNKLLITKEISKEFESRGIYLSKGVVEKTENKWKIRDEGDTYFVTLEMDGVSPNFGIYKFTLPEKINEKMYTQEEVDSNRVSLWDEDDKTGELKNAPNKFTWVQSKPTKEEINELWAWAEEESKRSGA